MFGKGFVLKNEMCLEATGATKIYGKTTVLQNVSMNVYRGEIHGLVGRNGAGK
ncbi:unannotated protein [freshwater metagenome]|nr:ATP-binding cassette domain-containing protein [Actinomycetota bacterium]